MELQTDTSPGKPALTRRRSLRALTLALAIGAIALAAAPLASAKSNVDQDAVRLTAAGFDFGDNTFVDGAPTGNGTLTWVLDNGALTPRLRGTLHLKNVRDICARMRMDFYNGNTFLKRKRGGKVCAPDDGHHSYRVDFRPYTDIRTTKVIVMIESRTAGGWLPTVSDTYWRNIRDDEVMLDTEGFDFGGAALIDDAPSEPATVDWEIVDGALTARVSGYLHINHRAGYCAIVRVTAYTGDGTGHEDQPSGAPVYGPFLCAPDNGPVSTYVDVTLAYWLPSPPQRIEALKVSIVSIDPTGADQREDARFVYVSKDF